MIKLIIVDDEITTRKGLLEYIPWKDLGVDIVKEAEDGTKALELALELQPDIVMTDIKMPKMTGIELAEQLKEKLPQCKVVFLSGYTDKEYMKSAIKLQAINYIEKPVDIEDVKNVMSAIITQCKKDQEKKKNELELISMVNESLPLLKERLCLELINSNNSKDSLSEKFNFVKIPYPMYQNYVSILINLNLKLSNKTELISKFKDDIFKVISTRIEEFSLNCLYTIKDTEYILLHIYGDNIKNDYTLQPILESIKEDINQILQLHNRIYIAVGKIVRDILGLPNSYQSAVISIQKQFFCGYNNISFYHDEYSLPYDFSQQSVQDFLDLLVEGKKSEAELFIKRVVHDLKLCNNTLINNIKNYFFNLLINLSNVCEERGIQLIESSNTKEYLWDIISKAGTLYEIEDYILKKIELFFVSMHEKENKKSVILSIMKYVKNNYNDENLSIKDIANYTYLTPNYLCLVFKKETGKTINQYITEIRIEKAKVLLKDRKIKLYEIASSVGINDPNYFAKIFKKSEGLNPSEFREKYLP